MAPLTYFALAALALSSAAAAPLPSPPSPSITIRPRDDWDTQDHPHFYDDWNPFGKELVKMLPTPKDALERAFEWERQMKGGNKKRDEGVAEKAKARGAENCFIGDQGCARDRDEDVPELVPTVFPKRACGPLEVHGPWCKDWVGDV